MNSLSLKDLAENLLSEARAASSGRAAHTIHGGHESVLRQTVLALANGYGLDEHDSPHEATLQVLAGRVRLSAGDDSQELAAGDYLVIPPVRHSLQTLEDSVVLLTVATGAGKF